MAGEVLHLLIFMLARMVGYNVKEGTVRSAYLAILGLAACSSAALPPNHAGEAGNSPTVLVSNGTCGAGHCMTLEIRAYIWSFPFPTSPRGSFALGEAHAGQTCLGFPPSFTATVTGPDDAGNMTTTNYVWTPSDTAGVTLIAIDSAATYGQLSPAGYDSVANAIPPYDGTAFGSVGETVKFVPGNATGWAMGFPDGQQPAAVATANPCTK